MYIKNKLLYIFISLLTILFPFTMEAREDEFSGDVFNVPKSIFISDVTTNIEDVGLGDTLQGQINIISNEDNVIADYKLSFELRQRRQSDQISIDRIDQARLINIQHNPKGLVIRPNTSITESFSYNIPQFLPEGDYYLRILLRNPESTMIDSKIIPVGYLSGGGLSKNSFVEISNASIDRRPDNTNWSLNIGISSNKDETLLLKGEAVLNGEEQVLDVYPKIVVYERAAGEKVVYESKNVDPIRLERGASKSFELPIPKLDVSGGYFAELVFEKDRQSISNIIDFHWVVSGESGRIINLTMNKTNFNKGEEAIIDIQITDRADLHFSEGDIKSLGNVKVVTTLNCSENYQKSVENIVDLNSNRSLKVSIPVSKDVQGCTVEAKLLKDDTELHSKTLAYTEDTDTGQIDKSQSNSRNAFLIISSVIAFIVLIVVIILYFIKKRQINSRLLLIPLLFIVSGLSYNSAMAGPCTDISIGITSPQPVPKQYAYGENIALDGYSVITYCTNLPADLKLSFYLDDNPTPFYNRDYYVPGAYSHYYSSGTGSIEFGVPSISSTALSPGWHKIRMNWFQDCTRQGQGTASGSVTRWFYVKPPSPTFRISPMDLRVRIGDKISYKAYYDPDGSASTPEQEVTNETSWNSTETDILKNLLRGQFEALREGSSRINASYSGISRSANVTILSENEPYLEINSDKNTLIYPDTATLTATLVEFDEDGQEIRTQIDNNAIIWTSQNINILQINTSNEGRATIKGVEAKEGYAQVSARIRKDGEWIRGISGPIQAKYPKLRIDPSSIVTNANNSTSQDVQFTAKFDHDANSSTPEQDVTSSRETVWRLPQGSILTNLGNGKFRIPPGNTIGNYQISVTRGDFDAKANLILQGVATPMKSEIIIELNKDRKIVAVATSRGGKFPYTYSNWKLIGEDNKEVPLEGNPIITNTPGNSGGNKVEFNVARSVGAPQKIKIQVESRDSGGAFDQPFKEFRYFGQTTITEVKP